MTTRPDEDLTFLEQLDLAPTCEYGYFKGGPSQPCGAPANLLVVYTTPWPCGCPPHPPEKYFCFSCWGLRQSYDYIIHFPTMPGGCGGVWKPTEGIARIIYL